LNNLEASRSLANPMTIAQIALAVKDVPFEDFVFVQYPTLEDPDDPNKVVPNQYAATTLWEAIKANKQLQITHENTKTDGVVVKDPAPDSSDADAKPDAEAGTDATQSPAPTPDPTATPGDVAELPPSIRGSSAA